MSPKTPRLGFDRYIALHWADMALEQRLLGSQPTDACEHLREWLSREISGKQTVLKTSRQLCRLWLTDHDVNQTLRHWALEQGLADNPSYRPLLHYGLALNVFPLFRVTCQATGRLLNLQAYCTRQDIRGRVIEKFGNPASIHTSVDRVIQTLVDWGFLKFEHRLFTAPMMLIADVKLTQWIIAALLQAQPARTLLLSDLANAPELLGIELQQVRDAIRLSPHLHIDRQLDKEVVVA